MEDPQNDYEWALERYNLDCSMYACWNPTAVIDERNMRYCIEHIMEAKGTIYRLET